MCGEGGAGRSTKAQGGERSILYILFLFLLQECLGDFYVGHVHVDLTRISYSLVDQLTQHPFAAQSSYQVPGIRSQGQVFTEPNGDFRRYTKGPIRTVMTMSLLSLALGPFKSSQVTSLHPSDNAWARLYHASKYVMKNLFLHAACYVI